MQVVIPQIELKAQVRLLHPKIPIRGLLYFQIPPGCGFQRAWEVTGRSNSLYCNKSVKCLCCGNGNKLSFPLTWKKKSFWLTWLPLTQSPFWTARCPVGAMQRLPFSQDWYSKWEENLKMIKGILKSIKKILNLMSILYLNQEFSKKLPHCCREQRKEPKYHKTEAEWKVQSQGN